MTSDINASTAHRGSETPRIPISSLSWFRNPRVRGRRNVPALVHHESAEEFDHGEAVLLEAGRPAFDEACVGTRLRLAFVQHFTPRVHRVALEQGVRQAPFLPPEVPHHVETKMNSR